MTGGEADSDQRRGFGGNGVDVTGLLLQIDEPNANPLLPVEVLVGELNCLWGRYLLGSPPVLRPATGHLVRRRRP